MGLNKANCSADMDIKTNANLPEGVFCIPVTKFKPCPGNNGFREAGFEAYPGWEAGVTYISLNWMVQKRGYPGNLKEGDCVFFEANGSKLSVLPLSTVVALPGFVFPKDADPQIKGEHVLVTHQAPGVQHVATKIASTRLRRHGYKVGKYDSGEISIVADVLVRATFIKTGAAPTDVSLELELVTGEELKEARKELVQKRQEELVPA